MKINWTPREGRAQRRVTTDDRGKHPMSPFWEPGDRTVIRLEPGHDRWIVEQHPDGTLWQASSEIAVELAWHYQRRRNWLAVVEPVDRIEGRIERIDGVLVLVD